MVVADMKSSHDSVNSHFNAIIPKAWLGDKDDGVDVAPAKLPKELQRPLGWRSFRCRSTGDCLPCFDQTCRLPAEEMLEAPASVRLCLQGSPRIQRIALLGSFHRSRSGTVPYRALPDHPVKRTQLCSGLLSRIRLLWSRPWLGVVAGDRPRRPLQRRLVFLIAEAPSLAGNVAVFERRNFVVGMQVSRCQVAAPAQRVAARLQPGTKERVLPLGLQRKQVVRPICRIPHTLGNVALIRAVRQAWHAHG